jgi:hypothetical protein
VRFDKKTFDAASKSARAWSKVSGAFAGKRSRIKPALPFSWLRVVRIFNARAPSSFARRSRFVVR